MTQAERDRLMHLAAINALAKSRNGRDLSPEARSWAMRWCLWEGRMSPMAAVSDVVAGVVATSENDGAKGV